MSNPVVQDRFSRITQRTPMVANIARDIAITCNRWSAKDCAYEVWNTRFHGHWKALQLSEYDALLVRRVCLSRLPTCRHERPCVELAQ